MINSRCWSCRFGSASRLKNSSACSASLPPQVPPLEDKRKDQPTPPTGHQPIRKSQLPQGRSSSNWQPSCHTWEQNPHPQWEACPATAMAWQEEWTPSNSQVDEQAQLLWGLSDRSVPRYRKPPPAQPMSPKSTAITPKRAEREVRFALSSEERASPHSSATMAKTAVPLPRKETQKEQDVRVRHPRMSASLQQGLGRTLRNAQCSKACLSGFTT